MCHILSSENLVPFSFKELKCSPRGAPSTSSIITYSLSSETKLTKQKKKNGQCNGKKSGKAHFSFAAIKVGFE